MSNKSKMDTRALYTILVCFHVVIVVNGHGRLVVPPSRSTMWRFGFKNPPNYNDNQLFCGGFYVQWTLNDGKCGVCGDNIKDDVRANEAPDGKYANGIIVKKYDTGQMMDISVALTANHKGWFEYRLCQNDDSKKAVQQECFDRHLLADQNGRTRFVILSEMKSVTHRVRLPAGVTCKNCVLQWKYNTGNNWGLDRETKKGCLGCGPQEQFYACADIAIGHPEIETGAMNKEVEIPSGDVDERNVLNKTVYYNPDGTCKPCSEGRTDTNTASTVLAAHRFTVYVIILPLTVFLTF